MGRMGLECVEHGGAYRTLYSVWANDEPDSFDMAQAFQTLAGTAIVGLTCGA
jgi:hypothetical protein